MARSADFPGPPQPLSDNERGADPQSSEVSTTPDPLPVRSKGKSFEREPDWRRFGTLAAGLAIGVAVGAGVALLMAPMSGADVRGMIGNRVRGLGDQAVDRWDDLRDELRYATHRGKRRVRRGVARSRWAAEDAVDRARR